MVSLPPVRPREYFRAHGEEVPLRHTLVVFVAASVAVTVAVYALGSIAIGMLDPAATVPNPDRPSETLCEHQSDAFTDVPTPSACDAPEEVPARDALREAFQGQLPIALLAVPFGGLLGAGLVHLLSRLSGGEGPFGTTLGIVAWSLTPSVVQSALAVGVLWWLTRGRSIADVSRFPGVLQDLANHPLLLAISVGGLLWSGAILYAGLRESRGHGAESALGITVVMVFLGLVFGVL